MVADGYAKMAHTNDDDSCHWNALLHVNCDGVRMTSVLAKQHAHLLPEGRTEDYHAEIKQGCNLHMERWL